MAGIAAAAIVTSKDRANDGSLFHSNETGIRIPNEIFRNAISGVVQVIQTHTWAVEPKIIYTINSAQFHEHLGYRLVGRFHQCGYKFGRWYDIVWMEKQVGSHTANPPAVKTFGKIKDLVARKLGIL